MNSADSQRMSAELEKLGYVWTDQPEDADVVVLNTCVVRQQAEDKVVGRLSSLGPLKSERPETVIALMGCLVGPKPAPGLTKRFPSVDVFVPPSETAPLIDLLRARHFDRRAREIDEGSIARTWSIQDGHPAASGERWDLPRTDRGRVVSAHVPIVYGCNWVCTFCIIPSRRGPERSRDRGEIVAEVEHLAAQGIREVVLLGQIVDRYGYDKGEADGLVHLFEALDAVDGIRRIRFLTSHPKFMSDAILDAVARLPKVMEQIEVPIQAGDDRTLARMKRGYTVDEYLALVERIRSRVPMAAIHTDVIVGFPGETEGEFEGTVKVLEEVRFDKVHLAKFSSRPGTVAAKVMEDDVSAREKERRRLVLDEIQAGVSAEINRRSLGSTVEVLVEGRDKDRWRGRTRTNKIVYFDHHRTDLLGELVDVEIEWTGPWSMVGRSSTARRAALDLEELALSAG
jgi:tRNA-2-methylthio-N6-dimethylallyladenosine synthase